MRCDDMNSVMNVSAPRRQNVELDTVFEMIRKLSR
jgi:hypothetical protein